MNSGKLASSTASGATNTSAGGKFHNRNLNSSIKSTQQPASYGSKGNYAVMQGNRAKSGRVSNATVVAPLPMNTPLRRDSKSTYNQSSSGSHPVWGSLSHGEKSEDSSSNASKLAPWAKVSDPSNSQVPNNESNSSNNGASNSNASNNISNINSSEVSSNRFSASTRNWAEMDSDDDDDDVYEPEGITINRDEVLESEIPINNSLNAMRSKVKDTSRTPTSLQAMMDEYQTRFGAHPDRPRDISRDRSDSKTQEFKRTYSNEASNISSSNSVSNEQTQNVSNAGVYSQSSHIPSQQHSQNILHLPNNGQPIPTAPTLSVPLQPPMNKPMHSQYDARQHTFQPDSMHNQYRPMGNYHSRGSVPTHRGNYEARDYYQREDGRVPYAAGPNMNVPVDDVDPEVKNQLDILEQARLERELLEQKKSRQVDEYFEPTDDRLNREQYGNEFRRPNDFYSGMRFNQNFTEFEERPFDRYNMQQDNSYNMNHRYDRQNQFPRYHNGPDGYINRSQPNPQQSRESRDYRSNDVERRVPNDEGTWERFKRSDNPPSRANSIDNTPKVPPKPPTLLNRNVSTSTNASSGEDTKSSSKLEAMIPKQATDNPVRSLDQFDSNNTGATNRGVQIETSQVDTQEPRKTFASLFPKSNRSSENEDRNQQIQSSDLMASTQNTSLANDKRTNKERVVSSEEEESQAIHDEPREMSRTGAQNDNRKKMLFDPKTKSMVATDDTNADAISKDKGHSRTQNTTFSKTVRSVAQNGRSVRDLPSDTIVQNTTKTTLVHENEGTHVKKHSQQNDLDANKIPEIRQTPIVDNSALPDQEIKGVRHLKNTSHLNNKSEDRMRLREERQKESAARGPRTPGVLYKFNTDGEIEQVLTEEERKALELANRNRKKRTESIADQKSNWRNTSHENQDSANQQNMKPALWDTPHEEDFDKTFNKKTSTIKKPKSNITTNSAIELSNYAHSSITSTVEVPVDYSGYDLDIQKVAAAADASRMLRGFQTFEPGYGLKDISAISNANNAPKVQSNALSLNSNVHESYGIDELSHIESILRSVDMDEDVSGTKAYLTTDIFASTSSFLRDSDLSNLNLNVTPFEAVPNPETNKENKLMEPTLTGVTSQSSDEIVSAEKRRPVREGKPVSAGRVGRGRGRGRGYLGRGSQEYKDNSSNTPIDSSEKLKENSQHSQIPNGENRFNNSNNIEETGSDEKQAMPPRGGPGRGRGGRGGRGGGRQQSKPTVSGENSQDASTSPEGGVSRPIPRRGGSDAPYGRGSRGRGTGRTSRPPTMTGTSLEVMAT